MSLADLLARTGALLAWIVTPSKARKEQEIARMRPNELLRTRRFWESQTGLLLYGALTLMGLLYLGPLAFPSEEQKAHAGESPWYLPYLALGIFPLAVYGFGLAAVAVADIRVNEAIARVVQYKAELLLSQIRAETAPRPDVEDLFKLVPAIDRKPEPPMQRLIHHICKEARDRRFESSVVLMQPYREESLGLLEGLEALQKLALRLGILGAFVGLLYAIGAIPTMLATVGKLSDDERAKQGWAHFMGLGETIFGALSVKFGTSVAGLFVAISASLFAGVVRRRLGEYFQHMEASAVAMSALAASSLNHDDYLASINAIVATNKSLGETMNEHRLTLQKSLDDVRRELDRQTGAIGDGLRGLSAAHQAFQTFLKDISERQSAFLRELGALYDAAAVVRKFEETNKAVAQAEAAVREQGQRVDHALGEVKAEIKSALASSVRTPMESHSHRLRALAIEPDEQVTDSKWMWLSDIGLTTPLRRTLVGAGVGVIFASLAIAWSLLLTK